MKHGCFKERRKNMTIEQYHEQYGDEIVMDVDRSIVANY